MSCSICSKSLEIFICECEVKGDLFCKEHLYRHIENFGTSGNHLFRNFLDNKAIINESRREFLLQQLVHIRDQSELLKKTTIVHTRKLVKNLKNSSKLAIDNLDYIINQSLLMIEKITSLSSVSRRILTPYERFICSSKEISLENLKAPKIVISSKTFAFELVLPTFIHELTTFSAHSVAFKENSLVTVPRSHFLHHPLFNGSSRCLAISPFKLLVTGFPSENGADMCVEVDFRFKTIKPAASLNVTRKWHAMAWLTDFPCVIGGNDCKKDLNSVEILKNDSWIKVPSMVIARSSLSAVSYMDKVWVVGGIDLATMNSIEVFYDDSWKLLSVRHDNFCSSVGLFGMGKYLVIFGGFRGKEKSMLGLFDVETHDLFQVSEFAEEFYFNLNSIGISSDDIFAIDANYCLKSKTKGSLYHRFKEISEIVNDEND